VSAGRLTLGSGASLNSAGVTVVNGASLAGSGTLGSTLVVNSGGHLELTSGSTLTSGALTLSSGSIVDIALGAPTVATPMASVNGNLVISASPTFNFTDAGDMANGTYRLFNYTGTLTYTGGSLGSVPTGILPGEIRLDISQSNIVNIIVNSMSLAAQYWDGIASGANGSIDGGGGVWNAGNTNWTNASGNTNDVWKGVSAVFQNGSGTVAIQGTQTISALRFKSDGYVLYADATNGLSLVNSSGGSVVATVDNGMTATLDTPLVGTGKLEKSGAGTLVLTRSNSYAGGTALTAGTLLVRDNNALGNGALSLASGTTLSSNLSALQLANNVVLAGASTVDV
ncbi:MAG: autotransporter-associated beta strand repeat-containing protein, partial [Pseudomonas sp.]